ncbi:hypothetical protein JJJ17_08965 [Paracoccus caeni]|uniref:Uncharacterized protein n=1 Tax=Paracoccus caeni TaxID=657651 RepID=A0A934SET4_9RHOB|nr:DUF6463 family protein [Paracoccus caeni]MBK4216054.1 hypothetical protein [Paracoccus caeni]
MFRIGAWLLIVTCILHLTLFAIEAGPFLAGWLGGLFWTMEHWQPLTQQSEAMILNGMAFWLWPGSLALPTLLLGLLLLWLDRRGQLLPRFPVVILALWALLLTAIMPNSGFPLVLIASGLMLLGKPRRGWA